MVRSRIEITRDCARSYQGASRRDKSAILNALTTATG